MAEIYTGVKTLAVSTEKINELYEKREISLEALDGRMNFHPNMFVIVTAGESQSAITRVKDKKLQIVKSKRKSFGVQSRNKEQDMALDLLLDDDVKVVVLTGRAGTGKTLISLSASFELMKKEKYRKLILTRPMTQVGKRELGILPGNVNEKFGPYLQNYINNIEQLTGSDDMEMLAEKYPMDLIPLQLIRGASWIDSFVIADEMQCIDFFELLTLGTRIGENSKIIIMGDLKQRDEKIAIEKTGIYKFVNDARSKASEFVGVVQLEKCERSDVSALFADIFEEE